VTATCLAQEQATSPDRAVHKTAHFVLHTDLSAGDAQQLLQRMERALDFAVDYWRRDPRGRIECYVVRDQAEWPDASLPHPLARVWIDGIGGATVGSADGVGRRMRVKATVFAAPQKGIAEHEVIHAYCCQTFGLTGPDWYKEGMAEVAAFQCGGVLEVRCPEEYIDHFRKSPQASIREIISGKDFTGGIYQALDSKLAQRKDVSRHLPMSAWTQRDADAVERVRRSYLTSWALCHLMVNNSNYSHRFRTLGTSYLTGGKHSFNSLFSEVKEQLAFEYGFFVQRVDVGYRVDLCSWDWEKRFSTTDQHRKQRASVVAKAGYQPSGLLVASGARYHYRSEGSWSTSPRGILVSADGDAKGAGRLEGVVMQQYQLSEPISLGSDGSFVAPLTGNLYLRCTDRWNALADNRGEIRVQLTTSP
jgi:hypothetical protein